MRRLISIFFILSFILAVVGIIFSAAPVTTSSNSNKNINSSTALPGSSHSNEYYTSNGSQHNYQQVGISLCVLSAALFIGASILIHKYGYAKPVNKSKSLINS